MRATWVSRKVNKQNPHFVPKILWAEKEYLEWLFRKHTYIWPVGKKGLLFIQFFKISKWFKNSKSQMFAVKTFLLTCGSPSVITHLLFLVCVSFQAFLLLVYVQYGVLHILLPFAFSLSKISG